MTVSVQLEIHEAPANSLERRYREWRETDEGKKIYSLFRRFAMERVLMLPHLRRRFGMKALAERVRWEARVETEWQAHAFKMNNNYTAYIARDLIREFPALKDLIEVRRVKEGD